MFSFSRFKIAGHSMEPLFKAGDRVIINRLAYIFTKPRVGDIVAVRNPKERNKILLKKIKNEQPKNQYFVVGINPVDSHDSRTFGSVGKDLILGKVWFRY
jgi:nickel-type superoxide dismutase maturation protease